VIIAGRRLHDRRRQFRARRAILRDHNNKALQSIGLGASNAEAQLQAVGSICGSPARMH
jgi:hypothetical protein